MSVEFFFIPSSLLTWVDKFFGGVYTGVYY